MTRAVTRTMAYAFKLLVLEILVVASCSAWKNPAWAAEEDSQVTSPAPNPTDGKTPAKKEKRGRIHREKEVEGTRAPNRFNSADSSPKSVYRDERTGQHYEVDTD
jgi:hypothetical protein